MKVFEPFKINQMELKNRMVVSAMVTNYCSEDGMATEKFIAYHEHKAKGGWGLIITEDYAVTPTACGFKKLPGLWEDGQIESHKELTRRIHEAGGKIAAQIYRAGRETSSAITGEQPIGPSALKDPTMPETPREMTVEEIHELVEQFGDCARRAKEAGFDAVEVHGAHGYLIGAFASPFSNKRSDEYGGTIRNRARFAMEIIENIKEKCGKDYPVLYRMSAVEYVPGGLEIEESKILARLVEEAGADCIHCSQGVYASTHVIIPPSVVPRAAYVENAAEFLTTGNKKFTEKSVVIYSSVSGNTKEMVQLVDRVHEIGARVFAFIDTPDSILTQPDKQDYLILYPMNEQLKFYMTANYLMYKNGEFDEYDRYNKEMETYLADALVQVEKDSDEWAYEYAKNKVAFLKEHKDLPHYFIGSGNQYGATYSYAMCYWEEQMWIRTKSISCQEFFHGMQEIIVDDTPVTLFMGEDEQRPLAERVARFLPRVNGNYTIIDTKEFELKGISPEYRGTISHLVMHGVNNRVDAYMELFLRHPLSIRRYYRQFEY